MAEISRPLLLAGWNLRKAVELAVTIEEMGAERYRRLAARWEANESLRALFDRLADEEVAHGHEARSLLATVAGHRSDPASELDESCLKAIAHDYLFAEDGVLGGIENVAAERQVLAAILKFENATLHFYRGLRDVLGPNTTLDAMIAEEKEHAVAIMRAMGEV